MFIQNMLGQMDALWKNIVGDETPTSWQKAIPNYRAKETDHHVQLAAQRMPQNTTSPRPVPVVIHQTPVTPVIVTMDTPFPTKPLPKPPSAPSMVGSMQSSATVSAAPLSPSADENAVSEAPVTSIDLEQDRQDFVLDLEEAAFKASFRCAYGSFSRRAALNLYDYFIRRGYKSWDLVSSCQKLGQLHDKKNLINDRVISKLQNASFLQTEFRKGYQLQKILGFSDNDLKGIYRTAERLVDTQRYQEASEILFFLTQLRPDKRSYWSKLGDNEWHASGPKNALVFYLIALAGGTEDTKSYEPCIRCFKAMERYEDAVRICDLAVFFAHKLYVENKSKDFTLSRSYCLIRNSIIKEHLMGIRPTKYSVEEPKPKLVKTPGNTNPFIDDLEYWAACKQGRGAEYLYGDGQ